MFIRWRVTNEHLPRITRHLAYLAECKRVDGKPRQKIIVYLGSIPAYALDGPGYAWRDFWFQVHCKLAKARVSKEVYWTTIHTLAKRVQLPTPEEWSRIFTEHQPSPFDATARQIEAGQRAQRKRSDILRSMSLAQQYHDQ